MLFAFIVSVMPLLAVAKTAAQGKMAMESWMLKPLSPQDEHFKPPSKSVSSYVDQSTYWLSTVYFSSTYCSTDEIIMKTAFPTGTCIQSDDPTDSFSSVSVYCYSEYTCYYYTYTDSNCGMYQTSYSVNLNMCQAGDADDDGYVTDDGNQYTAKQLIAQVGFPVPLPGNSTTLTYFNSMYCDQSSMSNYILAYPDYCYNNYNGTSRTSTKYSNPNLLSYQGNGCEPSMVDATVSYPPGACQIDFSTSPATSSMLVLNFPKPPVVPVNTAAIVGATVGGFAAIALLDAMLYFFVPSQSQSDDPTMQAQKSGEF